MTNTRYYKPTDIGYETKLKANLQKLWNERF